MSVLYSKRAVHTGPGEIALTLLRVVAGYTMAAHGWDKLTDVPGWQEHLVQMGVAAPTAFAWLAIAAELLGGAGLLVGLFTPVAAMGIMASMLTAITKVHWGHGLFAANGGFEYPLLMLCVATTFMLRGGGPLSLDALNYYARRHALKEPTYKPAATVPPTRGPRLSER